MLSAQVVNLTCVAGSSVTFTYSGPSGACVTTAPTKGNITMNFGNNCAATNQDVLQLQSQCGCCPIFNNDCLRYTNTNYLAGTDRFVIRGITYNVTITANRLFCPLGGSVTFFYTGPSGACVSTAPTKGSLRMNFGNNCAATNQDVLQIQSQCSCCAIFSGDCIRYTSTGAVNAGDLFVIRDNTYVIYIGNVLPVTLTSIKAYEQNTSVHVDWTTEEESNMDRYEIERSADPQQFETIGTVLPYNNNSGLTSSYTFIDQHPLNGISYYRLKMMENTGAVKYSKIVKVETGKGNPELVVAPNPIVGNKIQLQLYSLPKGRYMITLVNNTGQQIMNKEIMHDGNSAKQTITLDNNIAKGIYQLRIMGENVMLIKSVMK
jgi:hypothetical protein